MIKNVAKLSIILIIVLVLLSSCSRNDISDIENHIINAGNRVVGENDENSAIVTDKGLYKILQKHNIDVLYLNYEPDIKLLKNHQYSNRKGFIGGAISRIGDNIIIFGDLNKIDKDAQIRNFIETRGLKIINFRELDVIDYGGIVELDKGWK